MLNTVTMSSFCAPDTEIVELDHVEIAVAPWRWEFAQERREEIDRHFAARQHKQPALWNGRVLLLNRYTIDERVLRGASFETDYASFLAWRDWDLPDAGVANVFAAAALRSADEAYLVGRMAPSTSVAGQWLCPCGTPDPKDVSAAGMLDLTGSVGRELFEETGLDIGTLRRFSRLDETPRHRRKRRNAARPHHESSGDGGAAGIFRDPLPPQPGGFRSRHAAISHRLSGARMVLN
jgi:hypothetical protein